jgi:hypothetical protein
MQRCCRYCDRVFIFVIKLNLFYTGFCHACGHRFCVVLLSKILLRILGVGFVVCMYIRVWPILNDCVEREREIPYQTQLYLLTRFQVLFVNGQILRRTLFRTNSFLGSSLDHRGVVDHHQLAPLFAKSLGNRSGCRPYTQCHVYGLCMQTVSEYVTDQCFLHGSHAPQGSSSLRDPCLSRQGRSPTLTRNYSKWVWEIDLQIVLELGYATLRVASKIFCPDIIMTLKHPRHSSLYIRISHWSNIQRSQYTQHTRTLRS